MILEQSVMMLQRVIAVLVITLLLTVAIFGLRGSVKIFATVLLLIMTIAHYIVVFSVAKYVKVTLYPFILVEESPEGAVFYIDLGQLSVISLLLVWRNEITKFITRAKHRALCKCISE